jgi:predicted transcriptional regulator
MATVKWERSKHPLAVAMRENDITQQWLARKTGVQASTISRVTSGCTKGFSSDAARAILPAVKEYGVTLEHLILEQRV